MKIFIDTNVPIHHRPLDQIDWKSVTNADDVTLAISIVIFDELDKHTNTPRLASRAKRLRIQLYEFVKTGVVKGNVKAEIIQKPHSKILETYGLDSGQNDSWILGSIKEHMEKKPNDKVALVTADFGMRVRAEYSGIPTILLDEKYKLDEESDDQRENKKLKAEIEKYKSSIPKLNISFENEKSVFTVDLQLPDFDKYVRMERGRLRGLHPTVFEDETHSYHLGRDYSRQDAVTYNGQLEEYYKAYDKYLRERRELYTAEELTIKVLLMLKNSGSVLAKNIDVELSFPSSVFVSNKLPNARIREPNMPNPPTLGYLKPLSYSYDTNSFQKEDSIKELAKITATDKGTTVEYKFIELKQQKGLILPALFITLDEAEPRGFPIEYSIRAENVPDVVSGILNVNLEIASSK